MNCIVWNVRGLGNQRAFRSLNRLVVDEDPSLPFLCETKLQARQCMNLKSKLGFEGCYTRDCKGRKGGLMLLWKDTVSMEIMSSSPGHIDVVVSHDQRRWRFTGFYGDSRVDRRKFSWQLLLKLYSIQELSHLPWLVGGDFNEILLDSEKQGGRPRALFHMGDFQSTLNSCGLKDFSCNGEQLTWSNKQGEEDFMQCRLDRFVGSLDWYRLFPEAQVTNLSFYHSDHKAIKMVLGQSWVWVKKAAGRGRKRRFHFEEIWTTDEACRDVVSSAWNEGKIYHGPLGIPNRLKFCATKTDEWGFAKFGNLKKNINKLQKDIELKKTDSSYGSNVAVIQDMEASLESLLNQDEIYWKQRSRMEWLAHGDWNSKVFHLKGSKRERKNKISGLMD
ncbi:hypothetical protein UlMin_045802 [Ulmus minor]